MNLILSFENEKRIVEDDRIEDFAVYFLILHGCFFNPVVIRKIQQNRAVGNLALIGELLRWECKTHVIQNESK